MQPSLDDLAIASIEGAEREALIAEVTAAYAAELPLHERLASSVGQTLRVRLAPCPEITGTLMRAGRDHLWLADLHGYWLIAIDEIDGLSSGPQPARLAACTSAPPGMGSALRELVCSAHRVSVLVGDRWVEGRLRLVGADFVEFDNLILPLRRIRACRVWY